LTSQSDHIVMSIKETKQLTEIKIEDLQSTLEAHEFKHDRKHCKEEKPTLLTKTYVEVFF